MVTTKNGILSLAQSLFFDQGHRKDPNMKNLWKNLDLNGPKLHKWINQNSILLHPSRYFNDMSQFIIKMGFQNGVG